MAIRTVTERIRALRIKLRLFGILVEELTYLFGDNESVVKSTSKVEATLNKKHQVICWHAIREAAAAGWVQIGWEPTATNTADLFTKVMDTMTRQKLLRQIYPK